MQILAGLSTGSRLVATLIVVTLIGAACSPAPAASGPAGSSDAPAPSADAALEKLTIAYGADPQNLDPPQAGGVTEQVMTSQTFEGLVYRDRDGEVVPRLAESWETVSETTWRFSLRKGVTFHNGEAFNGEAVKFSIERWKADWSVQASRFKNIVGVDVVDEFTVDINLTAPDPILVNLLTTAFMMPPTYDTDNTNEFVAANPVGTGPYVFKEWVRGDHLTFAANADYWQGVPPIATVEFRPIPEASTRVAALQSGEVDIAWEIPSALVPSVESGDIADIKTVPGPRGVYIGMRTDGPTPAPQFGDVRVRQALNYAVNRQAIVDQLLGGMATLVGQPLPALYLGHDPSIEPYPYDPDKARQLLTEAGYPDGFSVQLDFGSRWLTKDQAQAVQADLAAVGVDLKLNELDPTEFLNSLVPDTYAPMYALSIQGRQALDASEIYNVAIVTDGSFNWNSYSNAEVDTFIAAGNVATDPAVREQNFQAAAKLLHDDPPWIYMWNNQSIWGVRQGVGWTPRSDDLLLVFDDVQ